MGRLILNVLLSFAQFEREIIAERTRDKIAATRRKGKWAGRPAAAGLRRGPARRPPAGQRRRGRARPCHLRAVPGAPGAAAGGAGVGAARLGQQVLADQEGPAAAAAGRSPRPACTACLTNVAYVGRVRYKDEVHPGEQPPLVDAGAFQRVGQVLARNGPTLGPPAPTGRGRCSRGCCTVGRAAAP